MLWSCGLKIGVLCENGGIRREFELSEDAPIFQNRMFPMENQNSQIYAQDAERNKDVTKWALPDGAIARLGRGQVQVLAISPDRKYLAVGTLIGVWVYECSTRVPLALWNTERGLISTLDFSANGKWLAAGNIDGIVKVWDLHRGICVSRMERPKRKSGKGREGISRVVFSRDSQYIVSSAQSTGVVYLWHAGTGERISRFCPTPDIPSEWRRWHRPLCFSDDGCLLACASSDDASGAVDFISIWHVKTGEHIASLKGHTALVRSLTFSACGQHLASADESGTLREWDIATGAQVKEVSYAESFRVTPYYHIIPSYSLAGNLLAVVVNHSTLTVWDAERREKLYTLEHHEPIRTIHFSNEKHQDEKGLGSVVAFASREEINIWTLDNPYIDAPISRYGSFPDVLTFTPDGGQIVSAGTSVTCWDVATKYPRRLIFRPDITYRSQKSIRSVYISPMGTIEALSTFRNMLYIWNLETNETIATLTGHREYVLAAVFAPTGQRWASGDHDGSVYVWDRQGQWKALQGHTDAIQALAFALDEQLLVSASSDGTVRLWHVAAGEEITSLPLAQLDAERYLGDSYHKQELIHRQHERHARENTLPRPEIKALAFSPCGDIIAGGLSGEIRFWDVATCEIRMAILLPEGCQRPYALAFSPSGRYLASGSWWQGTERVSIRLWEVASGEHIASFWGHPTDIHALAFSPDGALLASGSLDGTILLWDMKPYLQKNETS